MFDLDLRVIQDDIEHSPKRVKTDDRPSTPPHTRALRALIEDAFDEADAGAPTVTAQPITVNTHVTLDVERIHYKNMCRRSGILREHGGIDMFMKQQPPPCSVALAQSVVREDRKR